MSGISIVAQNAAIELMRAYPGMTLDNVSADYPDYTIIGRWLRRHDGELNGYLTHKQVITWARQEMSGSGGLGSTLACEARVPVELETRNWMNKKQDEDARFRRWREEEEE